MRILTCNIRNSFEEDGADNWDNRKTACTGVIAEQSADVICFQEMSPVQLAFLSRALPGYKTLSTLDQPATGQPMNTIFYRAEGFRPVSQGAYWLSQTPHVPGSSSWESDCVRLACWVQFVEAGGRSFRLVNTHLDHISQAAREGQARLINEDAAVYPSSFPQALTGDMNADAANPAIKSFLAAGWVDTYNEAHGILDPGRTYHEFKGPACTDPLGKIDWVFVRGGFRVKDARIIADNPGGRYPSDHYFVSADVEVAG